MLTIPITANPAFPICVRAHAIAFATREWHSIKFAIHLPKGGCLTELQSKFNAFDGHFHVVGIVIVVWIDDGFIERISRVETDVTSRFGTQRDGHNTPTIPFHDGRIVFLPNGVRDSVRIAYGTSSVGRHAGTDKVKLDIRPIVCWIRVFRIEPRKSFDT